MRLFTAAFFAGLALIAGLNLAARMVCLSRLPDPALLGRWGEGQAFNVPGYDTGEDKALLVAMMPTAPAVAFMDAVDLSPTDKAKVYGGNAERIFHIK